MEVYFATTEYIRHWWARLRNKIRDSTVTDRKFILSGYKFFSNWLGNSIQIWPSYFEAIDTDCKGYICSSKELRRSKEKSSFEEVTHPFFIGLKKHSKAAIVKTMWNLWKNTQINRTQLTDQKQTYINIFCWFLTEDQK